MAPNFKNDYGQIAHPRILEALSRCQKETHTPYGQDEHSILAGQKIAETFGCPGAKVHFLAGGTQTNLVAISLMLRHPFECVLAVDSAHINVHETGAIEGTGHKVVTIPAKSGKATPEEVRKAVRLHHDEHMVLPRVLYISNSTETGTIYNKEELLALRATCDELGLYLYIDGARLGVALTSPQNDVKPELIGQVADAFYVGGTKNGLLLGEALVLVNPALAENARYHIKNKGALLAKGYVVGIEFEEAFKDGLYFEIAQRMNQTASRLMKGLLELGLDVEPSPTNQIFVTLPKEAAEKAIEAFGCERWEERGEKTCIRFVTSFATTEKDVDDALTILKEILRK